MDKTNAAIEKLKGVGCTDDKLKQLLEIALEEAQDQLAEDLAAVTSDEETTTYEERMKSIKTTEEFTQLLTELSQKTYGENYLQKYDDLISSELEEDALLIKNTRDLYHKYMSGDPATVQQVKAMENSEEYKKLKEEMDAAGFDFQKAASE